jgi:hypothetical protein
MAPAIPLWAKGVKPFSVVSQESRENYQEEEVLLFVA